MKQHVKTLELAAVLAVALMAFAGSASATVLTDSLGTSYPAGTVIHSVAEETVTLHPPFGKVECSGSTFRGSISNAGGAEKTVGVALDSFSFFSCNSTVTVLKKGTLEIHTGFQSTGATSHQGASATGDGTLTSSGAEITINYIGTHCIFSTNNTDLGTLTGSHNFIEDVHGIIFPTITLSGGPTLDLNTTIPRTGGSSGIFCGSTAVWTGSYEMTPLYMDVD
jgi:hypothetical protein